MPVELRAAGAVFLSYASQDADAAKRVCDALRQAGVEVWFDQSELVGGDSWDAKIRGQIGSCALFVPIISVNTQARGEGYFRLEWKLAVDRSHLMAHDQPFLLPVVIDATADAAARVPVEFRVVQWTRLPAGETPPAFATRVINLLSGGSGSRETAAPPPAPREPGPPRKSNPSWFRYAWAGVGILFALIYALRPVWQSPRTKNEPPSARRAPTATAADALVAKARALLEDDPLMTRANVVLAEQLAREAVTQDQANAEAHAVLAWACYLLINERYDDTPQRRAELRDHAEKARLLAPDSVSGELAMCGHLLVANNRTEAQARLKVLAERAPDNITVLRTSAWAQIWNNKDVWGPADDRYPAELAKLRAVSPLGRAHAEALAAGLHWVRGEYVESDRANDRGFATGSPVRLNYLSRLLVLIYGWGDLPAARAFVETIPSQLLLEDVFIAHVSTLWLRSGESDKALEVLARTPREMLREARILDPTAMLRGDALAAAGRPAAAAVQWREALRVVDQQLAVDPANTSLLSTKAELLAALGDRAGAAAAFALFEETRHAAVGSIDWASSYAYFARLGDGDAVLARLDRYVSRDNGRWASGYNELRHDPLFAKVRADPRAQPILERATRWLEEMKSGRSTSWTVAPAAPPAADDKSVAVLAFANLSDDKANEYFSDGISEELLNVLAKIPGLKVTARTSSFHFKGMNTAIPEIAQQLGVAYVVEGSVRKQGDKVRITAQLIKAADGFHVWSDTFTRDLKDIFSVQDEIAGLVAKNLSLRLGMDRSTSGRATVPEAFELYLEGRAAWNLRTLEGYARAENLLNRAIDLDPGFARAHSALADVWSIAGYENESGGGTYGWRNSPTVAKVAAKAEQALALDPNSAEAYTSLATALEFRWKWEAAERAYQRAIELNPNYATARHWFGMLLWVQGKIGEALQQLKQATESDPFSHRILDTYARMLNQAARPDEALAVAERALALQPIAIQASTQKAHALALLGRTNEAVVLLEKVFALDPNIEQRTEALVVLQFAGADAAVRRVIGSVAELPPSQFKFAGLIALGRTDEALSGLRPADLHEGQLGAMAFSRFYDPVRDDPRFLLAISDVGYLEDYRRSRAWLAAHPPKAKK